VPIFFGSYVDFSIQQTNIYFLNARLAPEVLFHPVGSKISSHAFDAHFNVFDLRLRRRQNRQPDQ
jgi:hypothetical protein